MKDARFIHESKEGYIESVENLDPGQILEKVNRLLVEDQCEEIKVISKVEKVSIKELCEECSNAAKTVGWTKEDSRKVLKRVRNESTKELLKQLKQKEAVQVIPVEPYEKISVQINNKEQELQVNEGPVQIILIWD